MSISMNGISGADYSTIINQTQTSGLENKLNNINSDKIDDDMMTACKEFEAYMIEQVYKSMDKTIMRAEEKSQYEEYFGDMQVQEYAKSMTEQGGFGLAKQLYESMVRNQGPVSIENISTEG